MSEEPTPIEEVLIEDPEVIEYPQVPLVEEPTPVPYVERIREPRPKPEKTPKEDKAPKGPYDGKKSSADFKDKWTKLKKDGSSGHVHVPGTDKHILFSKVEVTDNVVSIWTSTEPSFSPDFVIVNPPAEDDALTAIAIAIDGATQ